ncbi:MAG: hypothetical protein AAFO82_10675 [Bacteroidota bacterium]
MESKDYTLNFVKDEIAIESPSGQAVTTMNLKISIPALANNKVVYEDNDLQANLTSQDKNGGKVGNSIRLQPQTNLREFQLQLGYTENAYISKDGESLFPLGDGKIMYSDSYDYQEIHSERMKVKNRFAPA